MTPTSTTRPVAARMTTARVAGTLTQDAHRKGYKNYVAAGGNVRSFIHGRG